MLWGQQNVMMSEKQLSDDLSLINNFTLKEKVSTDYTTGSTCVMCAYVCILSICKYNAKQKHLGCKKGEANQKQQLSDYKSIHSYTCD